MTGADSLMDIKGNGWLVQGNVATNGPEDGIQTHRILEGWGARNIIRDNVIDVLADGDHVYVHDPDITANEVSCSNRTGSGRPLVTNVPCTP